MEFAVTIDLTTPRPITEGQLIDLTELGGAAVVTPGDLAASVTMTVNAADATVAGQVAARQTCLAFHGATVEGVEVATTAEQDLRARSTRRLQ